MSFKRMISSAQSLGNDEGAAEADSGDHSPEINDAPASCDDVRA